MKIGTHNSATGERGNGLLSLLVMPFARTQSKTIGGQVLAGARYFDLRIKLHNDEWYCAHGLWTSKRQVQDILAELNEYAEMDDTEYYVSVTYEGTWDKPIGFENVAKELTDPYKYIHFTSFNVKKPKWVCLWSASDAPPTVQGFKSLDGTSWHTYIPIPYMWDKIFGKPEYNNNIYTLVDFI